MYPWYKGYLPDYKLSRDDTQQIQALFGECTFRKPYHLEGIVDITFTKKNTSSVVSGNERKENRKSWQGEHRGFKK